MLFTVGHSFLALRKGASYTERELSTACRLEVRPSMSAILPGPQNFEQ